MAELEPSPGDVQNALYAWAISNGILSDDAMREALGLGGNAALIPFSRELADYFKTRKIVKVSHSRKGQEHRFYIATRLPIARAKRERLRQRFADDFAQRNYSLELIVAKPFKIDQNVQSTFNPVYWHNNRVACGSSIGLGNQRNAGTLTALAKSSDGKIIGLSCNHVTGGCNTASVGTPIVCPGIQDVSPDNHEIIVIGLHDSTAPMSQGLPQVFDTRSNSDIAFFEVIAPELLSSLQGSGVGSYDTPIKFAKIKEGMRVKKWGRSTDLTRGELSKVVTEPESIEYNVVSYYGPASSQTFKGTVYFNELYEVESLDVSAFSAGGDSGSLVVSDQPGAEKIVGILIGGSSTKSYVLPIRAILKARKISLLNNMNVE